MGARKRGLGGQGGAGSVFLCPGVLQSSSKTVHLVAALSGRSCLLAFFKLIVMLAIGVGSLEDLVSLRLGDAMLALCDLRPSGTWRMSGRDVSLHHSSCGRSDGLKRRCVIVSGDLAKLSKDERGDLFGLAW